MSPSVVCQGVEFLFVNACGKCPRCDTESVAVLRKWGATPLCEMPNHIREAVMRSMEILGAERGVAAMREGSRGQAD